MDYKKQLKQVLDASGWSQEQLAVELGVSYPALNAWLNNRAIPRARARGRINELYVSIVGASSVSDSELALAKQEVYKYSVTAKQILSNQDMLDKLTLYLTYHTNTIEGSTMTLRDVEDVIFDNKVLSNRTAIEQLEAKNHQSALYWVLDQVADTKGGLNITEELILGTHLRLMNGIVSDAGTYRKHTVRIMGAHVPLANWQSVPALISELTISNDDTGDIVSLLAKFHARFEKIHPFSDGNGRTGRLLMLVQALDAGVVPPIVLKERKRAYYKYLERAQVKEDHAQLEYFIVESIQASSKLLL